MNILFICTGNTCRSPMAEGYLKSRGFSVLSRGLCADSLPVSENSRIAMQEIGIDISKHISRQITQKDIKWADKIICMSQSHADALKNVCECIVLGGGISDPYGMDINAYRQCRDQIITEINKLFSLEIILADQSHIKAIAELEKACFSTPWSEKTLIDAMQNGTKFFVAIKDGNVLGYIGISVILDECYITNVAVFENYRKQGVASAILTYLMDFAKENRLSFISLEVRESNLNAISLYSKFRFEKVGIRKNFYESPKENAIIMTKRF